jgi:hypothetical protein
MSMLTRRAGLPLLAHLFGMAHLEASLPLVGMISMSSPPASTAGV